MRTLIRTTETPTVAPVGDGALLFAVGRSVEAAPRLVAAAR